MAEDWVVGGTFVALTAPIPLGVAQLRLSTEAGEVVVPLEVLPIVPPRWREQSLPPAPFVYREIGATESVEHPPLPPATAAYESWVMRAWECEACGGQYVAVYPAGVPLVEIACPKCAEAPRA